MTFPAREASAESQTLAVTADGETITMTNIVIGDVWVMYGQSNMAFPLGKVQHRDMEAAQAKIQKCAPSCPGPSRGRIVEAGDAEPEILN